MADDDEPWEDSDDDGDTNMPISTAAAIENADEEEDSEEEETDPIPAQLQHIFDIYSEGARRLVRNTRHPGTAVPCDQISAAMSNTFTEKWAHIALHNQHIVNWTLISLLVDMKARKKSLMTSVIQNQMDIHGAQYRFEQSVFGTNASISFSKSPKTLTDCYVAYEPDTKKHDDLVTAAQITEVPFDLVQLNKHISTIFVQVSDHLFCH